MGIEGWVSIKYIITEEGYVEQLEVTDAEPEGVFEKSVRDAAKTMAIFTSDCGWRTGKKFLLSKKLFLVLMMNKSIFRKLFVEQNQFFLWVGFYSFFYCPQKTAASDADLPKLRTTYTESNQPAFGKKQDH